MARMVNIRFDKLVKPCENSWLVTINKQHCYFSYSKCKLDETAKVISCPLWLAEKKELESYIAE